MFKVMSNRLRHHHEPKRSRLCAVNGAQSGEGQQLTDLELFAPHHSSRHPGYQLRYYSQTTQRLGCQHQRPKPPPYFCFTVPKLQLLPFFESLAGLLFANLFWVGLWDLIDNTVFPDDWPYQMYLLIISGLLGLYFTNSLYEPPKGRFPQPSRSQARELTQPVPEPAAPPRPRGDMSWDQGPGQAAGEQRGLLENGDFFVDEPFVPPRWEPRRFAERTIANVAAVVLWTGIWNQIDDNALPLICSYDACGDCTEYGTFPCAWYKIAFILIGLLGMYVTRGLYCDHEVTYKLRRKPPRYCGCGRIATGARR